jgi:hypothetical protein
MYDNVKAIYIGIHVSLCDFDNGRAAVGCRSRVARFFRVQYTKEGENIPNDNTITKYPQNIPNSTKIFPMTRIYNNIFLSKVLKNIPNLGFLV